MPRQGNYTREKVFEQLDDHIEPGECDVAYLPRDLPPDLVVDYFRQKFDPDWGAANCSRAAEVARFYGTGGAADRFLQPLGAEPGNARDVDKQCYLIVAICEVGSPQQQQDALAAYWRSVDSSVLKDKYALEAVVKAFFSLPPRTPSQRLKDRVIALRTDCERKGPASALSRFMEAEHRALPWVVEEKGRKDWLLTMPGGPERLQRWAEAYLRFDTKTPFKWDRHAGFAFVRLSRQAGDEQAVVALKAAMERIDPDEDTDDAVRFRKTRGYKARAYFGDVLTEDQERDREKHTRPQDDLIQ